MDFNNIDSIKSKGFSGFQKVADLQNDISPIPDRRGVYFVVHHFDGIPAFIDPGTGGFFKGKDPNVSLEELKRNWVPDSRVVYVGKAGGTSSSATLRKRIKQYIQFGQGLDIGHFGGRYIWQLRDSGLLEICWKPLLSEEPGEVETAYLKEFYSLHGKLPFANLRF